MLVFIAFKKSSCRLTILAMFVCCSEQECHLDCMACACLRESLNNLQCFWRKPKSSSLLSNFSCCWEQTPFASKVPNSNPILPAFKIPLNHLAKDCGSVEAHLWAEVKFRLCFVSPDWQPPSALFAPDWKQATLSCHLWQQWGCSVHATNHQ